MIVEAKKDVNKKTPRPIEESKSGKVSPKIEFKSNQEEENKEIANMEKNVSIRFCNYSMLIRASQFSAGLST